MRLHVSPELMVVMRKPNNRDLRAVVSALSEGLFPDWAEPIPGHPERYMVEVGEDIEIQYTIDDQTDMERVITVVLAHENE